MWNLPKEIFRLAAAIDRLVESANNNKQDAILSRLAELEQNMALKVSELKNEIAGLKTQVTKIWGEQQAKYDALKAAFDAIELDPETDAELISFKKLLTDFDETIPDTTA